MRTLIWIPISCSAGGAATSFAGEHGIGQTDWPGIRKMVAELELPYPSVRLYQDALPCCEKEYEIVKQMAARGSSNHEFLLELVDDGARLVGTEDPSLLLHEYQLIQDSLGENRRNESDRQADRRQKLLFDRDRFIAARINETLPASDIGLLFLGENHFIEPLLEADILVTRLIPSVRNRRPIVQRTEHQQPTNSNFVFSR